MAMKSSYTTPWDTILPAASVRARHVRRSPGFIDEDELGRIKVQLIIEPPLTLFQDVRTALLYRVASLFLRVWPCRTRNRCKADLLMVMPWAESASRSSNKVPSRCSASHAMIASPWASVFREFRSPPRGPGRTSPWRSCRFRQRLTLAALTPNRSAASRWVAPAATAATTRTRRSTERAFDISADLHRQIV